MEGLPVTGFIFAMISIVAFVQLLRIIKKLKEKRPQLKAFEISSSTL